MQSPQIQTLEESERRIPAFAGIHFHCLNRITRRVCRLANDGLDNTGVGWVLFVHWCGWVAIPPTKGKVDYPTGDFGLQH